MNEIICPICTNKLKLNHNSYFCGVDYDTSLGNHFFWISHNPKNKYYTLEYENCKIQYFPNEKKLSVLIHNESYEYSEDNLNFDLLHKEIVYNIENYKYINFRIFLKQIKEFEIFS